VERTTVPEAPVDVDSHSVLRERDVDTTPRALDLVINTVTETEAMEF
jgi:hypothetical protein